MTIYYLIFVIILVLAGINFATLFWVTRLQRRLRANHGSASPRVPKTSVDATAQAILLAEQRHKLEVAAEKGFAVALEQATRGLGHDLAETSGRINHQLEALSTKVITEQLGEYQKTLVEMRQTAIASVGQIQAAIEEQRARLEQDINQDLEAQKQRLVAKLDQKIGDIVAAYMVEALGSQVDLGAQSQYLFKTLEANKAELKQDILSGP